MIYSNNKCPSCNSGFLDKTYEGQVKCLNCNMYQNLNKDGTIHNCHKIFGIYWVYWSVFTKETHIDKEPHIDRPDTITINALLPFNITEQQLKRYLLLK